MSKTFDPSKVQLVYGVKTSKGTFMKKSDSGYTHESKKPSCYNSRSMAENLVTSLLKYKPMSDLAPYEIVTYEVRVTEVSSSPAPIQPDPLKAARELGDKYIQEEWRKTENLFLHEASTFSKRSARLINEQRKAGVIYALLFPGLKDPLPRYPSWQFKADRKRLVAVIKPFFDANASSWSVHSFMMRRHEALDGMRGCDYVLDSKFPIDRIVDEVKRSLPGDQGAT